MHTRDESGINVDLMNNLDTTFTWKPPLRFKTDKDDGDDLMAGLEDMTLNELDEAFMQLDKQLWEEKRATTSADPDGTEVLKGDVYDFTELDIIGSSADDD